LRFRAGFWTQILAAKKSRPENFETFFQIGSR
jgi:hypothetical protein